MRLHKDAKIELLKRVPLFMGCSKAELQQIATLADELDLAEGATLIREGERGREFIVVDVSGEVNALPNRRSAIGATHRLVLPSASARDDQPVRERVVLLSWCHRTS